MSEACRKHGREATGKNNFRFENIKEMFYVE